MKKLLMAAAAVVALASAGAASADTINFGQFGGEFTSLPNTITTGLTTGGVGFTVTGPGSGFTILKQGNSWAGNFPTGTLLLFNSYAPGPMTFDFVTAISSITQLAIESNYYGNYIATLKAYDSSLTLLGTQNLNAVSAFAPGTVPAFNFSAPGISRLVISTTNDGVGFALGGAGGTGGYNSVPEPATWGLMIMGFGALGAMMRRRNATLATA